MFLSNTLPPLLFAKATNVSMTESLKFDLYSMCRFSFIYKRITHNFVGPEQPPSAEIVSDNQHPDQGEEDGEKVLSVKRGYVRLSPGEGSADSAARFTFWFCDLSK